MLNIDKNDLPKWARPINHRYKQIYQNYENEKAHSEWFENIKEKLEDMIQKQTIDCKIMNSFEMTSFRKWAYYHCDTRTNEKTYETTTNVTINDLQRYIDYWEKYKKDKESYLMKTEKLLKETRASYAVWRINKDFEPTKTKPIIEEDEETEDYAQKVREFLGNNK